MIYLASTSPRRRELLQQIEVAHRLVEVEVDETWDEAEAAPAHVVRLALEKARQGWRAIRQRDPRPVLGADTAVVLDDRILGKAETGAQAREFLARLSGRSHQVYSGVALVSGDGIERTALSITRVCFRPLTDAEQEAYCRSGEPLGKAGGYAIQGRAAAFVERIEGSYSGVVGLPLYETAQLLAAAG